MNFFIFIAFFLLNLITLTQANIVDELTNLNNLYKGGALTQEEFDKAKQILLKTNSEENKEIEPKQIIEIKKPISRNNTRTKTLRKPTLIKRN